MSVVFTITAGQDVYLSPSNGGTINFTIEPIAHSIPPGGTDGQVLAKASDTDYDVEWVTGGGGGGGANLAYTASPTNGIVTSDSGTDATLPLGTGTNAGLLAPAQFTKLSNLSGTNTGDQTSIIGITGTKSQFDTAVTDGNVQWVGDAPTAHTHPQSEVINLTTDLAAKAPIASPTFTGTVTTPAIVLSSETASKVAIIDASKNVKSADTATYPSLTELAYVKGVTSAIQTQIDGKQASGSYQPLDAELTAIAGLTSAADKGIQFTGSGTAATFDLTAAGKALLDDANAAAQLVTLGLTATATELNYTDGVTSAIQTQLDAKVAKATVPCEFIIACSDETTAITTGTAKVTFRAPYAFTLTAVRASVTTAPTGSTIVIDINETGTTVLSTKLSIDASEKTSTTAASAAVISDSAIADDAEITIDFDQVGSTIAGAGVKVTLIGTHAV
jgi:hypothetical protein